MGRLAGTVARACLTVGIALMATALARAEPAAAADLTVEQIEKIVRDYLMREPEVVFEALQELQRREAEATAERQRVAIAKNQKKLLEDPQTPIAGNPDGDVTVVEFFDYRCTYCRRVVASLRELLEEDRGLRVVLKDMPVLGPDSVRAARAALASRKQDATCRSTSPSWLATICRPPGSARPPRRLVSTRIGSKPTWMRPR